MRLSVCCARRGDQDHPKGRRRNPKMRPPADKAKQPWTVWGRRSDQKKLDTSNLVGEKREEVWGDSKTCERVGSGNRGCSGQCLFSACNRRAFFGVLAVTKTGAAGCEVSGKRSPWAPAHPRRGKCERLSVGGGSGSWAARIRPTGQREQWRFRRRPVPAGDSLGLGGTRRSDGGGVMETGGSEERRGGQHLRKVPGRRLQLRMGPGGGRHRLKQLPHTPPVLAGPGMWEAGMEVRLKQDGRTAGVHKSAGVIQAGTRPGE